MISRDPRLKRLSQSPGFIIINNFKCGFSSSNLLPSQPVHRISSGDTVILFYRNIYLRAVSVFINWCITDDRYKTTSGWLLENIRNLLDRSDYDHFVGLFHENLIGDAFDVYAQSLVHIFHMNSHTLPQTDILSHHEINQIRHHIELERSERFYRLTGIQFPYDQKNVSDAGVKKTLLQRLKDDGGLRKEIRDIYSADVAYFRDRDIVIDNL